MMPVKIARILRQGDRQTDRKTDRKTDRQTDVWCSCVAGGGAAAAAVAERCYRRQQK